MSWLKKGALLSSNTKNVLYQHIPNNRELRGVFTRFSRGKKITALAFGAVCIGSMLLFVLYINNLFLVEVPTKGGELVEGVIGFPRLINPLFLAKNDAEVDIAALTYSGLMRVSQKGSLEPDLAESYTVSEDGTIYTFTLREKLTWHDGAPLTASDIAFTIKKIQDPLIKSPHRAKWDGVTIETTDERTVIFTLPQPFARFLENTTLGILPEHIWSTIGSEEFPLTKFNEEPIGSGPYRFVKSNRDRSGIPTHYTFKAFDDFTLGEPYIRKLIVRFYPNESDLNQALARGEIKAVAALSANVAQQLQTATITIKTPDNPLPRVYAVFFNQDKQNIFTDENVRKALSLAVPRHAIVTQIFNGYATILNGPLPPGVLGGRLDTNTPLLNDSSAFTQAQALLEEAGWKRDATGLRYKKDVPLAFTLVTANTQEFKDVTGALKAVWDTLGAQVTVNVFEPNDLTENVIRPRQYEALFFGQAIGRDPDPYSFWHSSGRNDPGLNVALYANIKADEVLGRARIENDVDERASLLRQFEEEIAKDTPAVFVYAPHLIYMVPKDLRGVSFGIVNQASERFAQIHRWYLKTDLIWKVFAE